MKLAIIGGGAAGFFAAIRAAEQNPSAKVVVFEATNQPLEKVLVSGGGRCNVTHNCFDPAELVKNYPRGNRELRGPFSRFQPRDTMEWFEARGVKLKVESDGRIFPTTDDSHTIADCLFNAARSLGVEIRLGERVKEIRRTLRQAQGEVGSEDEGQAGCLPRTEDGRTGTSAAHDETLRQAQGEVVAGEDDRGAQAHKSVTPDKPGGSRTQSGGPSSQNGTGWMPAQGGHDNSGPNDSVGGRPPGLPLSSLTFEIDCHGHAAEQFERVLLATGSAHQGYRFAESLGHTIVAPVPSLFTFKITDKRLDGLAGLSFDHVHLTLTSESGDQLEQSGPLLITHWGLSGPAVLKLSAWGARILHDCNYHATLSINFLPALTAEQMYDRMLEYRDRNPKKHVGTEQALPIQLRFWKRIVEVSGVFDETIWSQITKEEMRKIITEFAHGQYAVRGKGIFKEEFVTCGGVDLREVDFKTMQSKLCPGLFFAGEILDIDGITGGFNFQNAWTTGWIAGSYIAL